MDFTQRPNLRLYEGIKSNVRLLHKPMIEACLLIFFIKLIEIDRSDQCVCFDRDKFLTGQCGTSAIRVCSQCEIDSPDDSKDLDQVEEIETLVSPF